MKKFLIFLLTIAISVMMVTSCGYYTEAINPITPPTGGEETPPEEKPGDGIDPELADMFTVSCEINGKPMTGITGKSVEWTGVDGSVYRATFNENNIAVCAQSDQMDGEYTISVLLGSNYAYKEDDYLASNENKHLVVKVYYAQNLNVHKWDNLNSIPTVRPGNIYAANCTNLQTNRFDVVQPDSVYFYMPRGCVLETWCSVIDNTVTPAINAYCANLLSGFVNPSAVVCRGGGSSGSFTKNIVVSWELYPELDEANCNLFGISATTVSGGRNATVYFSVTSADTGDTGNTGDTQYTTQRVEVKEKDLLKTFRPAGTFTYNYRATGNILRGELYKLFKVGTTDSAGHEGDGYYHVYYADSNTYGPTLFAMLTHDNEVFETEGSNTGFLYTLISLTQNGKDYSDFFGTSLEPKNYALFANSDGAHPVTQELKEFLQDFAIGSSYFSDGEGWAEDRTLNGKVSLRAAEEDQWLFCCGYYS